MENNETVDEKQFPKELVEEGEEPKDEKVSESLYAQIIKMTVTEKIRLATMGNREARNLLIKDPNKIVLAAVINSPKMNEDDAISYATNKSLPDEVVRLIVLRKEWLQNYKIKLALVTNPKTPPTISLKLLNHIMEKDLRNLSKSKNISPVIARAALRILNKQGRG
jgi:hypothetical protein